MTQMFWKIIFCIWLFCTVFNFGECFCANAKLNREYCKSALPKSNWFERFWNFIKLIVICALPVSNFALFMTLLFDSEGFYGKCKQNVEKKIRERKENT